MKIKDKPNAPGNECHHMCWACGICIENGDDDDYGGDDGGGGVPFEPEVHAAVYLYGPFYNSFA